MVLSLMAGRTKCDQVVRSIVRGLLLQEHLGAAEQLVRIFYFRQVRTSFLSRRSRMDASDATPTASAELKTGRTSRNSSPAPAELSRHPQPILEGLLLFLLR